MLRGKEIKSRDYWEKIIEKKRWLGNWGLKEKTLRGKDIEKERHLNEKILRERDIEDWKEKN